MNQHSNLACHGWFHMLSWQQADYVDLGPSTSGTKDIPLAACLFIGSSRKDIRMISNKHFFILVGNKYFAFLYIDADLVNYYEANGIKPANLDALVYIEGSR